MSVSNDQSDSIASTPYPAEGNEFFAIYVSITDFLS